LASAFFSGLEIAFISSNKLYIELEKKEDRFVSRLLVKLTKNPSKFITTMLVGNNIDETLKYFAFPAYLFYILFYFLSQTIMFISNTILKIMFKTQPDEIPLVFSKVELGNFISEQLESTKKTDNLDSEIQIFQNALDFQSVKAREVMIPRTEIVAVDVSESIATVKQEFIKTGLSKIIVYKENLDEIIGYIHSFELFKKPIKLNNILLPIEFVPETMMINDVMNSLIKKHKSIAVVIDEYGGTSGIITVEDIVEELFGEIEDEHDIIALLENKINDREFEFSARLEVDYLNETYNLELPEDESYETLGGLIVYHTENIPKQNDIIEIDKFQFNILKVSTTKIEEVYLKVLFKEK